MEVAPQFSAIIDLTWDVLQSFTTYFSNFKLERLFHASPRANLWGQPWFAMCHQLMSFILSLADGRPASTIAGFEFRLTSWASRVVRGSPSRWSIKSYWLHQLQPLIRCCYFAESHTVLMLQSWDCYILILSSCPTILNASLSAILHLAAAATKETHFQPNDTAEMLIAA